MKKKVLFKSINAKKLKKKIDSGDDFVLVDVLLKKNYEKEHLPKAINIPIADDHFEKQIRKKIPNKNKPVIVYCVNKSCLASPAAAKKFVEMGYKDVAHFGGGLDGWQEVGYSFESKKKKKINKYSESCSCCN